ncbi:MlaD family protein [Gordonia sp. ABSL1-1]|uniref:MlaD family protein n=1 Tax=Gordonia sp. ABSL1-1 TaxID=3053923 RepID=UPI0025727EE3|nr:MlaD family protein [Gordonia sp. ABSL1-1]MDL9938893.1 MlaD family protein [Gordonia sp. ABSL1-1]
MRAPGATMRNATVAAITAMLVLVTGACSLRPTDLPLPGTRVDGPSYAISVEFPSVLNLPARSKVLFNGSRIGVLREVRLGRDQSGRRRVAIATLDIERDVAIPVDSRAELTQATLLGDFYIAVTPPPDAVGPYLGDGGRIGLAHTAVSPQVEELLGGIAALANGGTVATLQRVVTNANKAFPADVTDRDTGIEVLRALIARSASEGESVKKIIDSIAAITRTLDTNAAKLGFAFDFGPRRVQGAVSAFLGLSNVLNALGPNVVPIGDLIIPRYPTLHGLVAVVDPLVATAARLDTQVPADVARLDRMLRDRIIPWLHHPQFDLVDVTTPDGRPAAAPTVDTRTLTAVLRMIGAVR